MKPKKVARLLFSVIIGGACLFGLAACSGGSIGGGGVAATVNGEEIMEDDVTSYIESYRKNNGLEDDEQWAAWLTASGMTPESIRETVIDYYKSITLIRQAAQEEGVTVSKSDIDAQVESMRANYDSDEAWQNALATAGYTEEEYRESVENSMLQQQLQAVILEENPPESATDDELVEYLVQYAPLFDGAKRSSHILFNSGDEETAKDVLAKINSGEISFEDAAKKYSTDTASAEKGGDVGWDQLNSFVTEYTDALSELDEGQVSDLVTSDFGIHIIKCTEVFNAPETVTSVDQVPSDLVEYVRTIADQNLEASVYSDWIADYEEKAEVVINDMPEGLPYDVEVESAEDAGSSENADQADGESEGDQVDEESSEKPAE